MASFGDSTMRRSSERGGFADAPASAQNVEAVVVGGNLCGLVTAYLLGHLGYRTVVVERSARTGGANASFTTSDGSTFDLGMHVLDFGRSETTTRLFTHVIEDRLNKVLLQRGLALRGRIMPYNPAPADMPAELRAILPGDELIDDLEEELPTRDRLRRIYGRYADFVFDEVLLSFRSEQRHKNLGIDEARLITNIYPWFFPRASRKLVTGRESRAFHDRLRRGEPQYVLYPRVGGFAAFGEAFLRKLAPNVEVLAGISDLHFEVDSESDRILWVQAHGRRFEPRRVFWCAAWPALCALLRLPVQNLATDNLLLGSFRFNEPALGSYNEILVGDPSFHIDRVSFPGIFSGSQAPLLQVEFAFPSADTDTPTEPDHWRRTWSSELERLRLLDRRHRVEVFDFRSFRMHYNSFGAEGVELRDADTALLKPGSNIHPVAPTMRNRNLNASVPLYLQSVIGALAGSS
jgi:glycine/D-amino acid oxidase-like deaminating enzyme